MTGGYVYYGALIYGRGVFLPGGWGLKHKLINTKVRERVFPL